MRTDEAAALQLVNDVARSVRALRRDATRLRCALGAALRGYRAIVRLTRSMPTLAFRPSDSPSGTEIVRRLSLYQPWPFRHRAVAVIALPSSFDDYLRGRQRQAVRTNRRRALDRDMRCVRHASRTDTGAMLEQLLRNHTFEPTIDDLLRELHARGVADLMFAVDGGGRPVAVAATFLDGEVAHLTAVQVGHSCTDRSSIRYLISTEIIRHLIATRTRHLLVDSMFFETPGVLYLEDRLGFVPMNVRVEKDTRRGWRNVARV